MPGRDQGNDSADDSRTAAVRPRSKQKPSRVTKPPPPPPLSSSSQSARGRRPPRSRRAGRQDPLDFVPRGATFTNASLPVENGDSSSDQLSDDGGSQHSPSDAAAQPLSDVIMQPAVNWNKGGGGAIRTSLRGSGGTSTPVSAPASAAFDAVNDRYWRNRSASASGDERPNSSTPSVNKPDNNSGDDGRISNESAGGLVMSEDSELESDAEADNSIMLNLSTPTQNENVVQTSAMNGMETFDSHANGPTETQTQMQEVRAESVIEQPPVSRDNAVSRKHNSAEKIAAFESFSSKYPSPPRTLADLAREDRDMQIKYIHYNKELKNVDMNLPIRCTDCMAEGHLSEICPYKECKHCGAWGIHESRFCPAWRRCQRCRERGHDEVDCPSLLKGLASEVPCDFCCSSQHIEGECDLLWKLPKRDLGISQIFVSVCCSFCTSKQHLLGDCPIRPFSMNSSSWTLRTVDPASIANLGDTKLSLDGQNTNRDEHLTGLRIKGRANERAESDEENDDFTGSTRWKPLNKQPPRTHIRFGSGIGRGRNLGEDRQDGNGGDRYIPHDYGREYRDREPFAGRSSRQRSLSPEPYPPRQRGGGSGRHPPPRSPPRGRGRHPLPPLPPPPARGGSKNKRGGSRGGKGAKNSDNRDVYRPMPSAAKRAWDKHRF
uniref:CCHC-type domain-containing protein n=1 Tax=Coccidioides posadasii RMSCC 3488 TaxID=454284 RepID=A0A0J6FEY6_COCPO|nr:hypothetical protein CPAG_08017 [Coccidioides posadasii RMSCC 3488]